MESFDRVLAVFCFIASAQAFNTFSTNCTYPSTKVSYVTGPNTRGSLDIIWMCVGSLIACVYTILHLNVQEQAHEKSAALQRVPTTAEAISTKPKTDSPAETPPKEHAENGNDASQTKDKDQEKQSPKPVTKPIKGKQCPWQADFTSDWNRFLHAVVAPNALHLACSLMLLFIPELLFSFSAIEYFDAWRMLKHLRKHLHQKGEHDAERGWTLAHMFYANMGGFVLLYKTREGLEDHKHHLKVKANPRLASEAIARLHRDQVTAGFFLGEDMSTSTIAKQVPKRDGKPSDESAENGWVDVSQIDPRSYTRYHLNAATLCSAVTKGLLRLEPEPEVLISDRSKSDWLAKLVVILQLVQFLVTIVARLAQNLPISPLEVATTGYVVCSIVTYFFLIRKPKQVSTTIPLFLQDQPYREVHELKRMWRENELDMKKIKRFEFPQTLAEVKDESYLEEGAPPGPLEPPFLETNLRYYVPAGLLGSSLFAAIHLAGWNIDFPTPVDSWLWRVSSIVSLALPLLWGACVSLEIRWARRGHHFETIPSPFGKVLMSPSGIVMTPFYFIVRMVLIVEMFRCLGYMPPTAFRTPDWSGSIPHFG